MLTWHLNRSPFPLVLGSSQGDGNQDFNGETTGNQDSNAKLQAITPHSLLPSLAPDTANSCLHQALAPATCPPKEHPERGGLQRLASADLLRLQRPWPLSQTLLRTCKTVVSCHIMSPREQRVMEMASCMFFHLK